MKRKEGLLQRELEGYFMTNLKACDQNSIGIK